VNPSIDLQTPPHADEPALRAGPPNCAIVAAADPAVTTPTNATSTPNPSARRPWVPVRSLTSRHRNRISAHLLALEDSDRYLRFGFLASDAQIGHYTDSIDFERDEVFGIFDRRLDLVAMAHLAYAPAPQISGKPPMAEFGVSVLRRSRGRGFGARLFDHAVLHARNRHIETLFIQSLSENIAMLKIARNAGATVERAGSESEAWLNLPPDDLASQVGAIVEDQAAEWDYRLKAHTRRVQKFMGAVSEAKAQLAEAVCRPVE
jgi:GNAT superfamily N-acetyltransferase